eukprot:115109_1
MAQPFLFCYSLAILIHGSQGLTIIANTSQYYGADIYCDPSSECNVICNSSSSCDGATIHWPQDKPYQLICEGSFACYHITYTPYYNGTNTITHDCIGYETCDWMTFHCPESAICNLNCHGEYSCHSIIVHIPSSSFANILCNGVEACTFAEFLGSGSLTCNQGYACQFATFPIPAPFESLTISCDAEHQCWGAIMYCPTDAQCTVFCGTYEGNSACDDTHIEPTTIVWPINPLYRPPIIDCKSPNYCFDKTYATYSPTYTPTAATSSPTLNPSMLPSMYPTSSPTNPPSLYPTSAPTNRPSLYPTTPTTKPTSPTVSPTAETIQPSFSPKMVTIYALNPYVSPSMHLSSAPTISPTATTTNESDHEDEEGVDMITILLVTFSFVLCCCVCIVSVFFCGRRIMRNVNDNNQATRAQKPVTAMTMMMNHNPLNSAKMVIPVGPVDTGIPMEIQHISNMIQQNDETHDTRTTVSGEEEGETYCNNDELVITDEGLNSDGIAQNIEKVMQDVANDPIVYADDDTTGGATAYS